MERTVELCDADGNPAGTMALLAAHENGGSLHRAFSAFVFRTSDGSRELLIQKRSSQKPVFPNRWANTCCSHPEPGEDVVAAGQRRLTEELGFTTALQKGPAFTYQALDEQTGLSEHEHDQILLGEFPAEAEVKPNPEEVAELHWVTAEDLKHQIDAQPEQFGPWFPLALELLEFDFSPK